MCFKYLKTEAPLCKRCFTGGGRGKAGFHFIFTLKTPFFRASTEVQISSEAI